MSFIETLVVLLVAVVVLGPKRLPSAARKVGHWMGVLRRASDEFKQQLMNMDQVVERTVEAVSKDAGSDLDHLLPTDEELAQALDFGVPPSSSPDEALEQEPVAGGLIRPEPEVAEEKPAPEPEQAPAQGTEIAEGVRSLGLSKTVPKGGEGA